ncbi:hypothetical protein QQF64_015923 [Cirrhinus molitorella]|uniref:Uncharacterized protein n=2 Tax=Cirrhinus molitorella TaxID=172907 RepID=A0ABR3LPT9_9TELE
MTGYIYFLFSSPVNPVNIPPFLLPQPLSLSLSLSQTHPDLLVLTHTAGGMLTFLRGAVQPVTVSRARDIVQKRNSSIYSKPPKNKIGPGQSFFIMSVFAVALLAPAGWILHHIPEYRQRAKPPPS